MRLSARVEYACLAIVALARHGSENKWVSAKAIAQDYQIPENYLAQILLQIKTAGLIQSTRGTLGGYRLARPAEAISLGEVITAIEGVEDSSHNREGWAACILAPIMEQLRADLGQVTMAQLLERAAPREWVI